MAKITIEYCNLGKATFISSELLDFGQSYRIQRASVSATLED